METNNLLALLGHALEDGNVSAIAKNIGSKDGATKKAIAAALPELLGALSKNASTEEGAKQIDSALEKHDGSILENVTGLLWGEKMSEWGKIIGHILWSQKADVVGKMSQKAGVSGVQSEQILKALAPLVMGALWKAKQEGGLQASDIAGLLTKSAGASNIFVQFLDQDGDGDFDKTDMITMAINYIKKSFLGGK